MKTINALWSICDTLAGKTEDAACAEAFIIAAEELDRLGISDWKASLDYEEAKKRVT